MRVPRVDAPGVEMADACAIMFVCGVTRFVSFGRALSEVCPEEEEEDDDDDDTSVRDEGDRAVDNDVGGVDGGVIICVSPLSFAVLSVWRPDEVRIVFTGFDGGDVVTIVAVAKVFAVCCVCFRGERVRYDFWEVWISCAAMLFDESESGGSGMVEPGTIPLENVTV